jgi:endonuclease/exonuclease/phosphatase family metal-dependent hydrolase
MRLVIWLLCLAMACVSLSAAAPAGAEADPATLCVMTYNLRYASAFPPNAWWQRREAMAECIRSVKPDLIGTQEGLYHQLKQMHEDLPEYEWIGLGREGGSHGEFMAVFYRKDRFDPQEYDHFWLSDTPNVIGSASWGNKPRRMVTWVRFIDRRTRGQFYLVNTHLDNAVEEARVKGAKLIVREMAKLNPAHPIIFTGDFNAPQESSAHDILTREGRFTDTWFSAGERVGPSFKTVHFYEKPTPNGAHIDWILTRGEFEVSATQVVTFAKDGQLPSDHFPVVAWMKIGGRK